MSFEITDLGDAKRVALKFERSAKAANNTMLPMNEIAADMMRVERVVFNSQGRRGGGSWKLLKAATAIRKGSTRILYNTGALERSLTEPGAEFQELKVTRKSILFGTRRPQAASHQHGALGAGIPKRPFLYFIPGDHARWGKIIAEHVIGPIIK